MLYQLQDYWFCTTQWLLFFLSSPAPLDLKRARVAEEQEANGSLILFDGPTVDDDDDDYTVQDEESKELANEYVVIITNHMWRSVFFI